MRAKGEDRFDRTRPYVLGHYGLGHKARTNKPAQMAADMPRTPSMLLGDTERPGRSSWLLPCDCFVPNAVVAVFSAIARGPAGGGLT